MSIKTGVKLAYKPIFILIFTSDVLNSYEKR